MRFPPHLSKNLTIRSVTTPRMHPVASGTPHIAFKELVAEIGACHLITELALPQSNHLSS
jgi:hypothetical protein